MLRAAWFAATGLILAIRSLQTFTNPNYMQPVSAADWFAVISFSVGLVALAAFPRLSHSADPIILTLGGYYSAAAGFTTTGQRSFAVRKACALETFSPR